MREQIEGSKAMARTIAACRPQVISAYPISPQTHIVEELSRLVKTGELAGCEYLNVESEFAAMSGAIGASATGARSYTATASQGLLYMVEAVFNASGMRLPIVMTVANRALGAPINIWNDHSDTMSQRDSGWLQLYAEDNQEAADLHVQAFAIAEELSVPVMVCVDGFILTHAFEAVDIPEQELVDAFLPPFVPRQRLDPATPVTMGAMVGPEAFTEVRWINHQVQLDALETVERVGRRWAEATGRTSGGLLRHYRTEDAETVVVALGSTVGTLKDVVDTRRAAGERIGLVTLVSFRPFPYAALREALAGRARVVVVERAFAPGVGGIVTQDLTAALAGTPSRVSTVVAGLGGRPITQGSLMAMLDDAGCDRLGPLTFLDLDEEVADREIARDRASRPSKTPAAPQPVPAAAKEEP